MTDKLPGPDLEDPEYWNGIIRMSLSKFFILCVLNEENLHGYDIAKQVARRTQGCCEPTEGTLYPALRQFAQSGYVTATSEVVSGRERKTYAITKSGRNAFQVALKEWMRVTQSLNDCAPNGNSCC